jgi:hypothetical protein
MLIWEPYSGGGESIKVPQCRRWWSCRMGLVLRRSIRPWESWRCRKAVVVVQITSKNWSGRAFPQQEAINVTCLLEVSPSRQGPLGSAWKVPLARKEGPAESGNLRWTLQRPFLLLSSPSALASRLSVFFLSRCHPGLPYRMWSCNEGR